MFNAIVPPKFRNRVDQETHGLDHNPLYLIERDVVAGPIIKLRRARAFMRGHRLRVFQRAAGFEIGGDAGRAEGVAADPHSHAEAAGAALDHAPGVDAVHSRYGERVGAADSRAEEGGLATITNAGRLDMGSFAQWYVKRHAHVRK